MEVLEPKWSMLSDSWRRHRLRRKRTCEYFRIICCRSCALVRIYSQMKKARDSYQELSRRDRQVLDALLDLGEATAQQVLEATHLPVSLSTIRTFLARLEERDFVVHRSSGKAYVYAPAKRVGSAMARRIGKRFVELAGSPAQAVALLLKSEGRSLTEEDAAYLRQLIDRMEDIDE